MEKGSAAASSSGNAKKKKASTEKRAKRYRATCPQSLRERLQRARTQRLYLVKQSDIPETVEDPSSGGAGSSKVEFTVLGSTGNVYTVTLAHVPSCNCPDHQKRQDLCKHILFTTLKVIGLDISDPLSYQKAYLSSELEVLFEKLRTRRVGGAVLANAKVRAAVTGTSIPEDDDDKNGNNNKRRSLEDGDADCPICFDALTGLPDHQLTYCRGTCGANFHADCIRRWLAASSHQGCPNCRQPWQQDAEAGAAGVTSNARRAASEGYANYGALQGQSPVRDTSTYYSPGYYKRRRWR